MSRGTSRRTPTDQDKRLLEEARQRLPALEQELTQATRSLISSLSPNAGSLG